MWALDFPPSKQCQRLLGLPLNGDLDSRSISELCRTLDFVPSAPLRLPVHSLSDGSDFKFACGPQDGY